MNNDNIDLQEHKYLRLNSVLELIPISRSTWYKWIQCGIAPKSTNISLRVAAWKAHDIKKLLIEMGKPEWTNHIKQKLKSAERQSRYP